MALFRKKPQYKYSTDTIRMDDEELAARIDERRSERASQMRRKRMSTLMVFILAFAVFATMCGRDIVRLKAENIELKRQQAELEKERDALKEELKTVNDPEYIREQARKQLKLLNPGEILFTFEEDQEQEEEGSTDESGDSEAGEGNE